jgi:hypothetical protein
MQAIITPLSVVPIEAFAGLREPGAAALLGNDGNAVIPYGGDFMVYGDGGAGKTTLMIDLACHLAAGDAWLGIEVARPAKVLLVENEGPRPHYRGKLRRKLAAWSGSPIGGRVVVLSEPWASLRLNETLHCVALADAIQQEAIDVVIIGPVTRSGMDDAGTLQQARDFMAQVESIRLRSGRPVSFGLVHHENKAGSVSGAWEASGDTLLHVQARGPGRTRLFVQKARWASAYHHMTLHMRWTDGEGFEVDATPDRTDAVITEEILNYIRANPKTPWGAVNGAVSGKKERKRQLLERLLVTREVVNVGTPGRMRLWRRDDPARPHDEVGSRRDPVGTGDQSHEGEATDALTGPGSPRIGDRAGADSLPPRTVERSNPWPSM